MHMLDIAQLNYKERRRHGERGADHVAYHNCAPQSPRLTRQRLDEGGNPAIANDLANICNANNYGMRERALAQAETGPAALQ
jgi:hypothetical protein